MTYRDTKHRDTEHRDTKHRVDKELKFFFTWMEIHFPSSGHLKGSKAGQGLSKSLTFLVNYKCFKIQ